MRTWRGRRCRTASAALRAVPIATTACSIGVALFAVLLCSPGSAGATTGSAADPDDVGTALDLKSVSHAVQGASIVYTARTYADFPDQVVTFKWGIDSNGDESFDLIVLAQWEAGRLVAGVSDATGKRIAAATVSRPAANAIAVAVPSSVLAGLTSYRYGVATSDDRNGNGKDDPGEQDLAPNSGLYGHALGASAAPATPSAVAPPAARVAASSETAEAPTAPATAPRDALPHTGRGGRLMALLAGGLLLAGGVTYMAETTVPRRQRRPLMASRDEEG
jgi:hypothetical protein